LCGFGGVAKVFDYCGEEEQERLEWSVYADGDEHVGPDLPVAHGILNVFGLDAGLEDGVIARPDFDLVTTTWSSQTVHCSRFWYRKPHQAF
jgi:hypothetical protein